MKGAATRWPSPLAMLFVRPTRGWVAVAALVISLSACTVWGGSSTQRVPAGGPRAEHAPERRLDRVPFFPQAQFQCGPAALASLLVDSGVSTGPDQLIPQVYLPAREGSLQADLISATRRAGRLAYPVPPQLDTLLAFIDEGLPVLVLQDLGFLFGHQWHYAVVFGYRLHGQEVLLRSGDQREVSMTVDAFERTWAPGGRWAIAALPPSPIPAPVDEARWVREAASLERTDARAAASAYRAALSRWPNSALAHFGLGNLAYAAGDVPGARAHFEALTQSHPDLADAWNNLAQVLLDLGDIDLASKAVERAIMLGGEHQSQFFQTRDAIRAGHEQRSPHTP